MCWHWYLGIPFSNNQDHFVIENYWLLVIESEEKNGEKTENRRVFSANVIFKIKFSTRFFNH